MSRQFMEEEVVEGGEQGASSTSSSDQVHYLHNGTVRRKLIVLKPESTFTSDPDRRSHLGHHADLIGNMSHPEKRLFYSPSDHGSHHARLSLFDSRMAASRPSWFSFKNCTRKMCLCLVVAVVSVIFGAAVGVYFGFRILDAETIKVKEFRGAFRVVSGDNYTQDLMDTFSGAFLSRSQLYKAKLDTMFVSSVLKKAYLGSEILAIDPGESEAGDDVIVRFNIRMDPNKIDVDAGDIYLVLINEVLKGRSRLLSGIKVDEDSIEVHERKSKFVPEREYQLSTIPLQQHRLNKNAKLVTLFSLDDKDEEEQLSTTTETVFHISENEKSSAMGRQQHDDQISSPTKTTETETLGYDFGSRLLEAILSGSVDVAADSVKSLNKSPDKFESGPTLNDDSSVHSSLPKKPSLHGVTLTPEEYDGYVATLPRMSVSERTETSESDKREISTDPQLPQKGSAHLPSINIVVHEHDNFPKQNINAQANDWHGNNNNQISSEVRDHDQKTENQDIKNQETVQRGFQRQGSGHRDLQDQEVRQRGSNDQEPEQRDSQDQMPEKQSHPSVVVHPPRIVSITELRSKSNNRASGQPTATYSPLRSTTKARYDRHELEAATRWETRRTKPARRRTTTLQPKSEPPTSSVTPSKYTRVGGRPNFGDSVRNMDNNKFVNITKSTVFSSGNGQQLAITTESFTRSVISRDKQTPIPNAETIASTLLPFMPLLNPDRHCVPPELDLCAKMDKNLTAIPPISSVLSMSPVDVFPAFDFIQSILESGCFEYAHYFICQLLQPGCQNGKPVLPCRHFCENFLEKCRYLLPKDLYQSLSCNILPEKHETKCVGKPECIHDLRSRGQNYLVCDGVVDCHDMSDETRCAWCSPGQFLCGGRKCIDKNLRCDGKADCPNEADERNCLALAKNGPEAKHAHPYMNEGFVFLNDKGSMGKICADTLLKSIPKDRRDIVLKNVGESACELLHYKKLKSAVARDDVDDMGPYFHILNPLSWRVTFLEAPCKSKQVIHVSCSNFLCGQRPSRTPEHMVRFLDSTKHVALVDHGDWPWHAALYSADIHLCDATLVSEQWLLTSSACFQGVPSRQWSARIGIVRMDSTAPFQQQRRVIGRVHSPVKGSDVVLVKLDRPVQLTDFVRPACLPTSDNHFTTGKRCVTLGWDLPRGHLRQVMVSITETEECLWRWPVGKLHVFCTAEPSGLLNDCQGEDQSGGPLLCDDNGTWYLTGVVNWRIGCGLAKQPRLYDSVSVNVNWIQTTIKNHQRASSTNNDVVQM